MVSDFFWESDKNWEHLLSTHIQHNILTSTFTDLQAPWAQEGGGLDKKKNHVSLDSPNIEATPWQCSEAIKTRVTPAPVSATVPAHASYHSSLSPHSHLILKPSFHNTTHWL